MAWTQDIAMNTLWYNNGAGNDPSEDTPPANVVNGAVAVNTADGLMWVKVTNGGLSGWEAVGGGGLSTPVSVANGGTNATSFSNKAVAITQDSGTDTLSSVTMSTNGQLLIGGTGGPTAATLTAGSNVTITNGNGTVTVAATDHYTGWTIVDSQSPFNSELITSAASVGFHGSGGISTTYSPAGNTIVIAYSSSSERYKENIADITFDTSKIFNLAPRSFTWRATSGNGLQGENDFGLIAEEVNEIIPELIFNNSDDEIQGIKLPALVTMLLVEMKKLKARVTVLEAG